MSTVWTIVPSSSPSTVLARSLNKFATIVVNSRVINVALNRTLYRYFLTKFESEYIVSFRARKLSKERLETVIECAYC